MTDLSQECFTCPMCGLCDETVPDPAYNSFDEGHDLCEVCFLTVPGWGDAFDSWPEGDSAGA